ncbi:nucleoside-diphosphate kinase [Vibrio barjaei]|uniref:nucleoside-diphosphate kinase n=1 Tax=Vibrio barjaei TaxID=1676683 RepID=UPI00228342B0|nr:nucleoside-diphosphate kinase [Vibrio barjaei]MCY9874598.1 nucleoside-diphosphate kinase [Vibrio barjaei]
MSKKEFTFGIIKPDVTVKGLDEVNKVVADINASGLEVVSVVHRFLDRGEAESFYAEHNAKPWFGDLIDYMVREPVALMLIGGANAVQNYRDLCGPTDPSDAAEGTLRAKYGTSRDENAVHSSDSVASAQRELHFFFPEFQIK